MNPHNSSGAASEYKDAAVKQLSEKSVMFGGRQSKKSWADERISVTSRLRRGLRF
jgi:hypothetical protein